MTETDNVDGPESYVDEEKNRLCVTWQLRIGSSRLFSAAHPSGPEIHIAMPLQPAAPIFKKSHPAIALLLRLFPLPLLLQLLKNHNASNQRGIFAIFVKFATSFLATWSMFLKIVFEK